MDTCHVVAGIGQVDKAGVYVPMTRGRVHNHLYLMETQAGDPDTAHHHLQVAERRDTTSYARELLIQAASRDRSDMSPHQLWRGARRDFELARLSSDQRTDVSPFEGTRMAEVMADRQARRRVRFEDFARNPSGITEPMQEQTPSQTVRESLPGRSLADVPDDLLGRMVDNPEQVRGDYAEAVAEVDQLEQQVGRAEQATAQLPTLSQQVEELTRASQRAGRELQQARNQLAQEDNRSVVGRLMRGGKIRQAREDVEQATVRSEQARDQLDQAKQQLDAAMKAQRLRPSGEQISAAATKEEHLGEMVAALKQPEVVQAEARWREQASGEVLRVDRNRRQHNAMMTPELAGLWAGGESWDEDWLARSLSRSTPQAADAGYQQLPGLGRDLEGGMDLS